MQYWFSFLQETLESNTPESAQKNINLEILRNLLIPAPPLPLQQHFASLVADAEILRQKQQQSERELEHLFQSLLQQYFSSGANNVSEMEETLSQVAEPEMQYAAQESN